jgi:pimeloyl-ACP methyl ester carboxylesterase
MTMRTAALAIAAAGIIASPLSGQQQTPGNEGRTIGPEGHYADVNGVHLYYETHGTGEPLVLLHGALGAGSMFDDNLAQLAKGRQVILVDLQGHGRTADIDRPLDPRYMADDVAALIRHLKLGRADVMGFSLGAGVALETAIRHPDVVRKVVSVSAIVRRRAMYPEILLQQATVNAAAADGMKQTPMYLAYHAVAPRPDDFPRLLDKLGTLMRSDFDYTPDIPRITAPVLLVQGDADIVPPSYAAELFGLLGGGKKDGGFDGSGKPRSRLAILPGRTHYDILDDPTLMPLAIAFLDAR